MSPNAGRAWPDRSASGVLLLSMPWHALERPSLGLSLLQAEVRARGERCEIAYLGFDLADFIGLEDYQWGAFGAPIHRVRR